MSFVQNMPVIYRSASSLAKSHVLVLIGLYLFIFFFSPHLCKFILKPNKNLASITVGCLMLLHIYILRDKDGRLSVFFFFFSGINFVFCKFWLCSEG